MGQTSSHIDENNILSISKDFHHYIKKTKVPYNKNIGREVLDKLKKFLNSNPDRVHIANIGKVILGSKSKTTGPERLYYQDILNDTEPLAAWLYSKGLGKNDVVSVITGTRVDVVIPLLATQLCQGTISAIGTQGLESTLKFQINESKSKFIFCTNNTMGNLREFMPEDVHIINMDTDMAKCISEGKNLPLPPAQTEFLDDEVGMISWSSGTTGIPKGIQMSKILLWHYVHDIHVPTR